MICKNCGAQNPDDAKICSQCHQSLEEQQNYSQSQPGNWQQTPSSPPPQDYGQSASPYAPPQQQGYGQAPPQGYGQPQSPYAPPPPYGYQQAPPYGQPYQQNYYAPYVQPGKGAATASLVCGIISVFFAGLILGIIAIVQGRKAKKLGYPGGRATAGIVLGILGIIGWVILMLLVAGGVLSSAFLL